MLVSDEKAEQVFRKVAAVQGHIRQYALSTESLKLSVEDLQWSIGDMYGISITKKEVSFDASHVRGMVERYANNTAIIYIRADQPDDWKRFVCTKELCHILIDEEEDWSAAGTTTIDALIYESNIQSTELASAQAQSETFALLAAQELVYPHRYRHADVKRLTEKRTTIKKIALEHGVPDFAVGRSLHSAYLEIATELWAKINP